MTRLFLIIRVTLSSQRKSTTSRLLRPLWVNLFGQQGILIVLEIIFSTFLGLTKNLTLRRKNQIWKWSIIRTRQSAAGTNLTSSSPSRKRQKLMASPGLDGLTAVASVPGGKTGFETAPVLQRHPRLLTMKDLDLQMEEEQEARVSSLLSKARHRTDLIFSSGASIENYLYFVPNKSASVVFFVHVLSRDRQLKYSIKAALLRSTREHTLHPPPVLVSETKRCSDGPRTKGESMVSRSRSSSLSPLDIAEESNRGQKILGRKFIKSYSKRLHSATPEG
jgi:hypothetical protein